MNPLHFTLFITLENISLDIECSYYRKKFLTGMKNFFHFGDA